MSRVSEVVDNIKDAVRKVVNPPKRFQYEDISSYVVIFGLLVLVTLFLIYLILNVNNKMDSFMKIYNDEQDRQYKDLDSTFNKIHKSNENLKKIIQNADSNLGSTVNNFEKIKNDINTNQELIQENANTMENINNNISISDNVINIGPNQELTLSDKNIQINLQNDANFKLCDIDGENCSRIITKNYVEQNLPIIPTEGSN